MRGELFMDDNKQQILKQQVEDLITFYGPEKVRAVAQGLLTTSSRPIPAEYFPVLAPLVIEDTLGQLDAAARWVETTTNDKEAAYSNKMALVVQQAQFETAVKLAEAEAFMNVQGEGKEQYGLIGDKKITLNNDTNRDAYRRCYSAKERRQLADISGKISAIDVDLAQANDALQAAFERSHSVTAKARLQAALLNYLAGRE